MGEREEERERERMVLQGSQRDGRGYGRGIKPI